MESVLSRGLQQKISRTGGGIHETLITRTKIDGRVPAGQLLLSIEVPSADSPLTRGTGLNVEYFVSNVVSTGSDINHDDGAQSCTLDASL